MTKYPDAWYIQEYLRDNFAQKYGNTDPTKLASIARELMPKLPNEVDGWPEEILHIILGEIAGYSEPTIYNRVQIANANLICSNQESVESLVAWNQHFKIESSVPAILVHQPDWIVEVVDPMISRSFKFCPEHPDHRIIWQSPAKRHK